MRERLKLRELRMEARAARVSIEWDNNDDAASVDSFFETEGLLTSAGDNPFLDYHPAPVPWRDRVRLRSV